MSSSELDRDHLSTASSPVTLLFTDIEESTGLWERYRQDMARALAAHDTLARQSIERRGGSIVKMTGDGVLAVFADPVDAINAVLEMQNLVSDSRITHGVPLRVRCGLHVGIVERRGGDVFGNHVNRAARIMEAAHGGQVLISAALAEELHGRLPPDVSLRDLGPARLRGVAIAERIAQLMHPGMRADFPPLRFLEATPHNLPHQLTSFVGRRSELQQIDAMLMSHRLLTLLGMGGLGKTRLALQAAANALERFADGVWFVDLAPVRDPSLVAPTIAQTLAIREEADHPILDTLASHLRSRALLVILDNCEHLLASCAETAKSLLQRAPNLRILATSREALGIVGEQIYLVAPLTVPTQGAGAGDIMRSPAVQLFADRMRLLRPAFAPSDREASVIAEVCAKLEGIPLALELAAARASTLSLDEINLRLRDKLEFLARTRHTGQERQRTMRALVAWSYELLRPDEQILFERVSVFAGGFDLEAVSSVCAMTPLEPKSIEWILAALVEKSLVYCDHEHSSSRYHMLETLRDFAKERLVERGAMDEIEDRHCDYFFRLAKQARAGLLGAAQGEWIRRVELELDNIRTALKVPFSERGNPVLAVKFQVAMQGFWILRGYLSEGRASVRQALAREAVQSFPLARAFALYVGGTLAFSQGDYVEAIEMLERCLDLRRGLVNDIDIAAALSTLGIVLTYAGHPGKAKELQREALVLFRKMGDRIGEAIVLCQLGQSSFELHADEEAHDLFAESASIAEQIAHIELQAEAERMLGRLALEKGDDAEAVQRFHRSLRICEGAGNRRDEAVSRSLVAQASVATGNLALAREQLKIALIAFGELEVNAEMIQALEDCALLACSLRRERQAAMLLAAAEAARTRLKLKRATRSVERFETAVAKARQALGHAFEAVWIEGSGLDVQEAAQLALCHVLIEGG